MATAALVAAVFFAVFLAAVEALRELLAGTTTFLTEAAFTGAVPARAAVEPARVFFAAATLPAADFGAGLALPACEPAGLVAAAVRALVLRAGPRVDDERSAGVLARGSGAALPAAVFLAAGFLSAAFLAGVSSSASTLTALARFLGLGAASSSSAPSEALTSPVRPPPSLIATGLPPQISYRR